MKLSAVVLAVILLGGDALATTWAPSEKTDPMTGEKVPSYEIMSYGGYIYNWPSKYHLVFWPFTDEKWICLNPKNGYAAFNNDFEKLSHEEKKGLSHWLQENYKPDNPPKSHEEKLAWLEKVYGQRKMDDEFWCRFYRLMAYVHSEDQKTTIAYLRKAVPFLEKKVSSNPDGVAKLEVLYLLGEYHRRLGDGEKALEFFAQVKDVKYKDEEGREQTGHPYFIELVKDRQKLMTERSSNKSNPGDGN